MNYRTLLSSALVAFAVFAGTQLHAVTPAINNFPLSAAATVGAAFSYTLIASDSPTSYGATGLPVGLSINSSSGVITGTPTTAGISIANLSATNSSGTGRAKFTITVVAPNLAPVIASPIAVFVSGTVGSPFTPYQIAATGLPTTLTAVNLPPGLIFNATTGTITGTPTVADIWFVALTATNSVGPGTATLMIVIVPAVSAPVFTSARTAPGSVGTAFASYTLEATGLPTSFTATGLPAGLSFNSATATITGTATTAGTTNVALTATNSLGTGTATLNITIAGPGLAPIFSSPNTATGVAGTPFSTFSVAATGSPTSYSATGLPAGLSFNTSTGAITGTPTVAATAIVSLGATNGAGTTTGLMTITITPATLAPIITSQTNAAATVGVAFNYILFATGLPTSYTTVGLPVGLTLNTVTGLISGTPTTAGTTVVTIIATNSVGADNSFLTLTVAAPGLIPTITSPSTTNTSGKIGVPFVTYFIEATGVPTNYTATNLPPGFSVNAITGAIDGMPKEAGAWFVNLSATNARGTGTATLLIVVSVPGSALPVPVITSATSASGTIGTPLATYLITASGTPTSYSAAGLPLGLTLNATTGTISGTPTVLGTSAVAISATNSTGTGTAVLTITISNVGTSRIVNFSARAVSGPGDQTLIVGFVVTGGSKNLLVRAVGPTLSAYGVTTVLTDPMLTLYNTSGAAIIANDNWQTASNGQDQSATIAATATRVGAFALPNGSKDSSTLTALNGGGYTVSLGGSNGPSGVALAEIYDTDAASGSRLINVSARMNVTAGEGTLIAGFSITGNAPKKVLIRGIGPGLTAYGVTGVLSDPTITVFANGARVDTNDDWSTGTTPAAQLSAAYAQSGAFPLPTGSKDAALLLTLPPGGYTVQVTGVANTTGVALVEVYDVP
jgi:hypothetical protein